MDRTVGAPRKLCLGNVQPRTSAVEVGTRRLLTQMTLRPTLIPNSAYYTNQLDTEVLPLQFPTEITKKACYQLRRSKQKRKWSPGAPNLGSSEKDVTVLSVWLAGEAGVLVTFRAVQGEKGRSYQRCRCIGCRYSVPCSYGVCSDRIRELQLMYSSCSYAGQNFRVGFLRKEVMLSTSSHLQDKFDAS